MKNEMQRKKRENIRNRSNVERRKKGEKV